MVTPRPIPERGPMRRYAEAINRLSDLADALKIQPGLGYTVHRTAHGQTIKLTNSHRMRIDNVSMLGSYYGLHLNGALPNTMVDLRSGVNFQSNFYTNGFSQNQFWVYGERFNGIAANANTFVDRKSTRLNSSHRT